MKTPDFNHSQIFYKQFNALSFMNVFLPSSHYSEYFLIWQYLYFTMERVDGKLLSGTEKMS